MDFEIIIKSIPDNYDEEDVKWVIDELKEPAIIYFLKKKGTGITWLPDSDIKIYMREVEL